MSETNNVRDDDAASEAPDQPEPGSLTDAQRRALDKAIEHLAGTDRPTDEPEPKRGRLLGRASEPKRGRLLGRRPEPKRGRLLGRAPHKEGKSEPDAE